MSSDGAGTYAIDTYEPSCTCLGFVNTGRCYRVLAATLLDGHTHKAA